MSSPRLPSVKLIIQFCSVAAAIAAIVVGGRRLAAAHGPRLADRAPPRLLRVYVDCLPRLAQTVGGRASSHGCLNAAGGPASFNTGSPCQFSSRIVRRRRGVRGGSAC